MIIKKARVTPMVVLLPLLIIAVALVYFLQPTPTPTVIAPDYDGDTFTVDRVALPATADELQHTINGKDLQGGL